MTIRPFLLAEIWATAPRLLALSVRHLIRPWQPLIRHVPRRQPATPVPTVGVQGHIAFLQFSPRCGGSNAAQSQGELMSSGVS
jgi:hypothetical protein